MTNEEYSTEVKIAKKERKYAIFWYLTIVFIFFLSVSKAEAAPVFTISSAGVVTADSGQGFRFDSALFKTAVSGASVAEITNTPDVVGVNLVAAGGTTDGTYIWVFCTTYCYNGATATTYGYGSITLTRSGGVWTYVSDTGFGPAVTCLAGTSCFTTVTPSNGTTTATSSQSVGFTATIDTSDAHVDGKFRFTIRENAFGQLACAFCGLAPGNNNGGTVLDITLNNAIAGDYSYSTTTSFSRIGKYYLKVTWTIPRWNFLGVSFGSKEVVATSTEFNVVVGANTFENSYSELIDKVNEALASSTASVMDSCTPLSGNFNVGTCLIGLIVPPEAAIADSITILRSQAPWGYVFRFIDILGGNATTSTTTLPVIAYTFGTTSIFYQAGIEDISLDPFGTLLEADSIVNAKSDQTEQKTIWEIMNPIIYIIVYMALLFMIIRDLTGTNDYTTTEYGSETVTESKILENGERKTFTHGITKRRKL